MKVKRNDNPSSSSAMKTIRIMCVIVIMAVLSCALSIVILSAAGVITIGGGNNTQSGIVYNTNSDEEEQEDANSTVSNDKKPKASSKKDIAEGSGQQAAEDNKKSIQATPTSKGIIVLDPGHGISSSAMSDTQKQQDGWIYSSQKGGWGEWRHFKSGTIWQDCMGSGCIGRAPKNGGCWYPIGNGDRDTEPELNMNNVLAAKKYLEEMGYTVRVTRTSTNNPSMTKRVEYCYPNNDITSNPDADLFVCVHANAGGGSGSYYIALSGQYDQAGIPADYIERGNRAGKCINDRIVSETALSAAAGGRYDGYPELILFFKSPIPIAYMEIGFYDNASDLAIIKSSSDAIGKAIAEGIDDYMNM